MITASQLLALQYCLYVSSIRSVPAFIQVRVNLDIATVRRSVPIEYGYHSINKSTL